MTDFKNSVALITGGSSGIGEELAYLISERGGSVAVVASTSIEKANLVVEKIQTAGGIASAFTADVRSRSNVTAMVEAVAATYGGIDILVNAAGVFYPTSLDDTAEDDLDRIVDVNIKGTWNVTSAVVPYLKSRGGGGILNFASVAGIAGVKNFSLYCATKSAIVMLTRVLGAELAPHNIRVNALAPGNTATPMNAAMREDPVHQEQLEALQAITPSNTTFSDPREIAEAGAFLLSAAARPIIGTTLVTDEGLSATVA